MKNFYPLSLQPLESNVESESDTATSTVYIIYVINIIYFKNCTMFVVN